MNAPSASVPRSSSLVVGRGCSVRFGRKNSLWNIPRSRSYRYLVPNSPPFRCSSVFERASRARNPAHRAHKRAVYALPASNTPGQRPIGREYNKDHQACLRREFRVRIVALPLISMKFRVARRYALSCMEWSDTKTSFPSLSAYSHVGCSQSSKQMLSSKEKKRRGIPGGRGFPAAVESSFFPAYCQYASGDASHQPSIQ